MWYIAEFFLSTVHQYEDISATALDSPEVLLSDDHDSKDNAIYLLYCELHLWNPNQEWTVEKYISKAFSDQNQQYNSNLLLSQPH